MLAAVDGVGGETGTTGHRGRWAGLVVGAVVLAVLVVAGAFVVSPVAGTWVLVALAAALLVGGGVAAWTGRRQGATPEPAVEPPAPAVAPSPTVREVDDLQSFFDVPPGSPATLTAGPVAEPAAPADTAPTDTAPADTAPADEPDERSTPPPAAGADPAAAHEQVTARRIAVGLTTTAVVVVVGALVAATVTDDDGPRRGDRPGSAETPTNAPAVPRTTTAAAPLTAAAAGDLALVSVPTGGDGLSARLSFGGIVLEPRAVGATVTTPSLSVSTDGDTGLVHLTLPTWNCLESVAPADPAAAGCTPAPTEYADLATPDLRVTARDGEFEVSGDFATYTRPNGSAPTYTGRSYALTVQAGPDGRFRDGTAPATGVFSLGGSSVQTLTADALSVVQTG